MDSYKAYISRHKKRDDFFKSVSISDIHFGKLNPEDEYNILNEQFINRLKNVNFDVMCIAGDLFHKKELANSDTIKYATLFIMKCEKLCIEKDATLIILDGTYEHDSNQLKLFHPLKIHSECDIRIVEDISFQYVKGYKILCIPEKYGMGEQYYNDFLNNYYDLCFAHATYVGSIHGKNEKNLDSRREPVFDIDDFDTCYGPILSGHVHTARCYDKHFYYHGSPIRSQFGEESDKGFYYALVNRYTQMYYVHFEKINSYEYNTYNIDKYIDNLESCYKYIENLEGDYIRLICKKNSPNINLLKDYYKDNKKIKIESNYKYNSNEIESSSDIIEDEFSFIFNKDLSEYDILAMYINKNENENVITGNDIKNVLNKLI